MNSTLRGIACVLFAACASVAHADVWDDMMTEMMSDFDGSGTLPPASIESYGFMSTSEMMLTEAWRRFHDPEWNNNVPLVSSRALWVDYTRALGVSAYLSEATAAKKARVEALLAVYAAQKLTTVKLEADVAHERAQEAGIRQDIK